MPTTTARPAATVASRFGRSQSRQPGQPAGQRHDPEDRREVRIPIRGDRVADPDQAQMGARTRRWATQTTGNQRTLFRRATTAALTMTTPITATA